MPYLRFNNKKTYRDMTKKKAAPGPGVTLPKGIRLRLRTDGTPTYQVVVRKNGAVVDRQTFEFLENAIAYQNKRKAEAELGLLKDRRVAKQMSLGDLITRYRDEVSVKHKGAEPEISRLNKMLRHSMMRFKMADLEPSQIADYRDERLEDVSDETVRKELQLIKTAITRAMREWGLRLGENPADLVALPSANSARERRCTPDEEARLLAEIDGGGRNPWLKPIVILAIETAMRRGELISLRWSQVDWRDMVIHLSASGTKTARPRDVPVTPRAEEVLRQLYTRRKEHQTDNVFGRLTADAVKTAWRRAVARAKIEDLRFHDLRHEATSRFFEIWHFSEARVRSITGHTGNQMMMRYTHLSAANTAQEMREQQHEASARLRKVIPFKPKPAPKRRGAA